MTSTDDVSGQDFTSMRQGMLATFGQFREVSSLNIVIRLQENFP